MMTPASRTEATIRRRWAVGGALAGAGLLLGSCGSTQSALDPHGPHAARIADVWWILFWLGTAVYIVVMALLAIGVVRGRRRRRREGADLLRTGGGVRYVVVGGAIIPAIILVGIMGLTLRTSRALVSMNGPAALTVEVIGNDWWWDVRYPEQGIVTANEIHIPAGRDVEFRVTSNDVIHSFWVPQLGGKTDMIPGDTNTFRLRADTPGVYRGQCAEFCGVQHANMAFTIVAEPSDQFAAWLDQMRRPPPAPTDPLAQQGQQVFLNNVCIACHAVAGTTAAGTVGPNLSKLATRDRIAAGTLRNTPENLATWITAAQRVKPGNNMPSFDDLDPESVAALVAYLQTLK